MGSEFRTWGQPEFNVYCSIPEISVHTNILYHLLFQEIFEELFKQHGDIMSIIYLKSFSRARVIYHSENDASHAKDKLHGFTLGENQLGVYFTQVERGGGFQPLPYNINP